MRPSHSTIFRLVEIIWRCLRPTASTRGDQFLGQGLEQLYDIELAAAQRRRDVGHRLIGDPRQCVRVETGAAQILPQSQGVGTSLIVATRLPKRSAKVKVGRGSLPIRKNGSRVTASREQSRWSGSYSAVIRRLEVRDLG